MASFAVAERLALCELASAVGPDAPTLCDGWTVRDLIAHLYVREAKPLAALGLVVPGLGRRHETELANVLASYDFDQLVELVASGKDRMPIFKAGKFAEFLNEFEYFVHHEDIRRASGVRVRPRVLAKDFDDDLWTKLPRFAQFRLRKLGHGVIFARKVEGLATAEKVVVCTGPDPVTVTGEAGELLLWLYGRGEYAEVEFAGSNAGCRKLARARLNI